MQHPFSCIPDVLSAIEATISPARLARFIHEAKGDKHLALRLLVWNARLCESFYIPTQFAEVSARNAIQRSVGLRFGATWYESAGFVNILPLRLQDELDRVVKEEKGARGITFTPDHVVAGLSFGFWLNLLTSRYDKQLWMNGMRRSFPHLPRQHRRDDVYKTLDQLRRFRNKIAHHSAIFDKNPRAEHANAIEIIGWICPQTQWLTSELSDVMRVLGRKPRV